MWTAVFKYSAVQRSFNKEASCDGPDDYDDDCHDDMWNVCLKEIRELLGLDAVSLIVKKDRLNSFTALNIRMVMMMMG